MSAVFNERNLSRSYCLLVSSATISTLYCIFLLTPIMRWTILVFVPFFLSFFSLSFYFFLFVSQLLKSPVDRLNYLVSRTLYFSFLPFFCYYSFFLSINLFYFWLIPIFSIFSSISSFLQSVILFSRYHSLCIYFSFMLCRYSFSSPIHSCFWSRL